VDRVVTIQVSDTLLEHIRREGERAYPAECCGVLAGHPGETKVVTRLWPVMNRRTDDPHRYLIPAEDLQRIAGELRSAGLEVLGFYHSHPDHPAAPSIFDTEHAWPWYSYVIVRVERGRAADSASWQLAPDRSAMLPESLEILSEV
jgi:proteasome lid subunit RPN8/RPN11